MKRVLVAAGCCALLVGGAGAVRAGSPGDAPRALSALPTEARSHPERYLVVTIAEPPRPPPPRAIGTPRAYGVSRPYGPSAAAQRAADDLARAYGLHSVAAWPIALLAVHCVVYRLDDGAVPDATLARLRADARVEAAQRLAIATTLEAPAVRYDDPYRRLQRNLDSLSIERAHTASRGAGTRLVLVDSGVDASHPDLRSRRIRVRDFVGTGAAGERHGTELAGVIAAVPNNRLGIAGIAPDADLQAYRACVQPDAGAPARCDTLSLARALVAAIESRADVINLSLAGPADPLLSRLVVRALADGAIVVAAIPPSRDDTEFPGSVPGVLTVASAATPHSGAVHAPADDVPTLVPGGTYDFASGSSLAAAQVAATAALMRSARPGLAAADLRLALLASERTTDAEAHRSVDACRALAAITSRARCDDDARMADRDPAD